MHRERFQWSKDIRHIAGILGHICGVYWDISVVEGQVAGRRIPGFWYFLVSLHAATDFRDTREAAAAAQGHLAFDLQDSATHWKLSSFFLEANAGQGDNSTRERRRFIVLHLLQGRDHSEIRQVSDNAPHNDCPADGWFAFLRFFRFNLAQACHRKWFEKVK